MTVNGRDLSWGSGEGWTYDSASDLLTLGSEGTYTLSGKREGNFGVTVDAEATVILSNVTISSSVRAPLKANAVDLTVLLAGENRLIVSDEDLWVAAIVCSPGKSLTIGLADGQTDESARLVAVGGDESAGIGGCYGNSGSSVDIRIEGGTIMATGGEEGAGIGSGFDSDATVTISGGTITATGCWGAGIGGGFFSAATVTISGGNVTATGGDSGAGIGSGDVGEATVTISGGEVTAQGGEDGAGIGGGYKAAGTVMIRGGTITATGGDNAAGIGGGYCGEATVMICGGTVSATAGCNAADDIGMPYDPNGTVAVMIAGGSVLPDRVTSPTNTAGQSVWRVTVSGGWADGTPVEVTGLENYGTNDIVARDGKVCLWLPDGRHIFSINGVTYGADVKGANTAAVEKAEKGVTVNGDDIAWGTGEGWTYNPASDLLTIGSAGTYTLSGKREGKFGVTVDAEATVILSNVTISSSVRAPLKANAVDLTVLLAGTNRLVATDVVIESHTNSSMSAGLEISPGKSLTIGLADGQTDASARLVAFGNSFAAGIGGCDGTSGSSVDIRIEGGTIEATGGQFGAGIGGGWKTAGTTVTISGGTITATGGKDGAGIGGGDQGKATVTISGGTIEATGGECGAGIGCGSYGEATVTISGGKVTALGGDCAAGIGTGYFSRGAVTITGGTVSATAGFLAHDIGKDYNPSGTVAVRIDGGSVLADRVTNPTNAVGQAVWRVTVQGDWADGTPVAVTGLGNYGTNDIVALDGKIYLWLPDGRHRFRANGVPYGVVVSGANATAFQMVDTDVQVDGADIAWGAGDGWTFAGGVLTLADARAYVVSGSDTADRVHVVVSQATEVTISNLVLTTTSGSPLTFAGAGTSVLHLAGASTLKSIVKDYFSDFIGYPGVCVGSGVRLVIDAAAGLADEAAKVDVTGGRNQAGIGPDRTETGATSVEIRSGTVVVKGGTNSAGIGSGSGCVRTPAVTVSGGVVTAIAGYAAASIGQGQRSSGGSVTISGGRVTAGDCHPVPEIGGGSDCPVTIVGGTVSARNIGCKASESVFVAPRAAISGGSYNGAAGTGELTPTNAAGQAVWRVTVPGGWADGTRVAVTELEGYGTDDIFAVGGNIYLWLPDGKTAFGVGGVYFEATVDGAPTVAERYYYTGIIINGEEVRFPDGRGWTYDTTSGLVSLTGGLDYVVSGTNLWNTVRLVVTAPTTVTLEDLCIEATGVFVSGDPAPLAVDATNVTIRLRGENVLTGGPGCPGLSGMDGSAFTIDTAEGETDESARLLATGGRMASGIGTGYGIGAYALSGSGSIVIAGGTIEAVGGTMGGAGIGSGSVCSSTPEITICGGIVCASGTYTAAGIGEGTQSYGGRVTISGGRVTAVGGSEALSDIGVGDHVELKGVDGSHVCPVTVAGGTVDADVLGDMKGADYTVRTTITGGSFRGEAGTNDVAGAGDLTPTNAVGATVWRVTVPGAWADGERLAVTGLDGYGTDDIYAYGGNIYLWLADGTYDFSVNGVVYQVSVDGGPATAVKVVFVRVIQPTGESLRLTSFAEALGVVTNGSKVELLGDIAYEATLGVFECPSFELDGQGHRLEIWNGSGGEAFRVRYGENLVLANTVFDGQWTTGSLVRADMGGLALTNCVVTRFLQRNGGIVSTMDACSRVADCVFTGNDAGDGELLTFSSLSVLTSGVSVCVAESLVLTNNLCGAAVGSCNTTAAADAYRFLGTWKTDNGSPAFRLKDGLSVFEAGALGDVEAVVVECGAALAFTNAAADHVWLDVPEAFSRTGDLLITNLCGTAADPSCVRFKDADLHACGENGNVYLDSAESYRYAVRRGDAFEAYRTYDEAASESDIYLVRCRDTSRRLDLDALDGLTVACGSTNTLRSVLRVRTDDAVAWQTDTAENVTVTGTVTVVGRLILEDVRLSGELRLAGGTVEIGEGFRFYADPIRVTATEAAETNAEVEVIHSDFHTGNQLLDSFALVSDCVMFEPTEHGLRIVACPERVARIVNDLGTTWYGGLSQALRAAETNDTISLLATPTRDLVQLGADARVGSGKNLTVRSIRETNTVDGVALDENPSEPVLLRASGGTLTIEDGATLAFDNVAVTGTLRLAGMGCLDLARHTGPLVVHPTRAGLIATNAVPGVADVRLAPEVGGSLIWKGSNVWWRSGTFSARFIQTGNGTGSVEIDDYGVAASISVRDCKSGTFTCTYRDQTGLTGTESNLTFGVLYCVVDDPKADPYVVLPPKELYATTAFPSYRTPKGTYKTLKGNSQNRWRVVDDLPSGKEDRDHRTPYYLDVENYGEKCRLMTFLRIEDKDHGFAFLQLMRTTNFFGELTELFVDCGLDIVGDLDDLFGILDGDLIGGIIENTFGVLKEIFNNLKVRMCVVYRGDGEDRSDYYTEARISDAYDTALKNREDINFYKSCEAQPYTLKTMNENWGLVIDFGAYPHYKRGKIAGIVVGDIVEVETGLDILGNICGNITEWWQQKKSDIFQGIMDDRFPHGVVVAKRNRFGILNNEPMLTVSSGFSLQINMYDVTANGPTSFELFDRPQKVHDTLFEVHGWLHMDDCEFTTSKLDTKNGIVHVRNTGTVYVDGKVTSENKGDPNFLVDEGGLVLLGTKISSKEIKKTKIGISGQVERGDVFSSDKLTVSRSLETYESVFSNDAHSGYKIEIDDEFRVKWAGSEEEVIPYTPFDFRVRLRQQMRPGVIQLKIVGDGLQDVTYALWGRNNPTNEWRLIDFTDSRWIDVPVSDTKKIYKYYRATGNRPRIK